MHGDVFTQLSLVIVAAAGISLLMRFLKQPYIMGYILTGIIAGPSLLNLIESKESFDTFSEIGIALLLFIIGLELSASVVKRLGKSVILTAMTLLFTVGTLGYVFAVAFFDFTVTEAVIAGLALFFSSTIIIAKVLSDKKCTGIYSGSRQNRKPPVRNQYRPGCFGVPKHQHHLERIYL